MTLTELYKQFNIIKLQFQVLVLKQKRTIPNLSNPKYIIIHHGGGDWYFDQINRSHKAKWGFKSSLGFFIGYQYFIEYSGRVYRARSDFEEGAHTIGYNKTAIGICLQGNTDLKPPTENQLDSLKILINRKVQQYKIPNSRIWGHRRVKNTSCPGKYLYKWLIENYKE